MLDTIRTYFDVNSTSLAHYLGISPDMLKSISSGRRDWALAPLLAATQLFEALDQNIPVEELAYARAFPERESGEETPMLLREIKRLERELESRREQLVRLKESRQRLFRGLHACESLLQTNLDAHQRKWLGLRKRQLGLKLREKSDLKIKLLEAEIAGLASQVQFIKNYHTA